MEIKDILELARLGYKPNDIKELLAFKPEDPKKDDSEDLNPDDSDDSDKSDKKEQKKPEDPIDAIIKRNLEEKE